MSFLRCSHALRPLAARLCVQSQRQASTQASIMYTAVATSTGSRANGTSRTDTIGPLTMQMPKEVSRWDPGTMERTGKQVGAGGPELSEHTVRIHWTQIDSYPKAPIYRPHADPSVCVSCAARR